MSTTVRVAQNTIIQVIGKAISIVLGLLSIAILTRYLGPERFGNYTTVITYLLFFATLADLGITLVTAQMISQPDVDEKRILSNLFSFRLISSFTLIILGVIISWFLNYDFTIKLGILVTFSSFVFANLNQVFVGLFQKKLYMYYVVVAEIASRVVLFGGFWATYYYDFGLNGALVVMIASSFVSFILHYYYSLRFVKIKFLIELSVWKQIVKKSWPLAITIFFNLVYLKTDTIILSFIKPQVDVGLYGAAYRVIDVLITLPFLFSGIVLPLLTIEWAKNNRDKFNNLIQKSFDFLAIISVPLVVGTYFVADKVMVVVAGDDFLGSGRPLKILMIAAVFIFLGNIFAHVIIAVEKQRVIIPAYIFTAVTSLIGYIIFVPRYSFIGAAWVTVYSELCVSFASFWVASKYISFIVSPKVILKAIISSLFMGVVIFYTLPFVNIFLIILLSIFVYTIFIFLTRATTVSEVKQIFNNVKE